MSAVGIHITPTKVKRYDERKFKGKVLTIDGKPTDGRSNGDLTVRNPFNEKLTKLALKFVRIHLGFIPRKLTS